MKTALAAVFLKIAALVSAIATSAVAVLIVGWQVLTWILTAEWNPLPISAALALAGLEDPPVYVTASSPSNSGGRSSQFQVMYDWLLDLPATGSLLAVAAILLGFAVFAASVEKQIAASERYSRTS